MEPRRPTIAQVNVLLLISLVLVVGASFLTARLHFYWTLLSREVLLILVPALLFIVVLRLPWRETLRWRLPNWRTLIGCVLIALGGWLFDSWLGTLFGEILDFTLPLPPDFYPTTLGQALALFCLLAIVAPICEEVLFRGLIQRGYEQRGVAASIVITGLLFVLFHQSLAQGLALIPLSILLSYVAWRTDSLPACILAHAINNAPAALLLPLVTLLPQLGETFEAAGLSSDAPYEAGADVAAQLSEINPVFCALPFALLGLALVLAGLWTIRRWSPPPPPLAREPLRTGFFPWLGRAWPLFLILPLILLAMVGEVVMSRFPELLSMGRTVQWAPAPWEGPGAGAPETYAWTYEIRNARDERVGQVACTLRPDENAFALACSREQRPYEVETGRSTTYGEAVNEQSTALWQRPGLSLQSAERRQETEEGWRQSTVQPAGERVTVIQDRDDGTRDVARLAHQPRAALLDALPWPGRKPPPPPLPVVLESSEWPWRLSALPFQGFFSAQASWVEPYPPDGGEPTLTPSHVIVYGSEPVSTPAGTFVAWRVEVGPDHVAWYDSEAPHTLVALESGQERWVLVEEGIGD